MRRREAILRLAVSIAIGIPADLNDAFCGPDRAIGLLAISAARRASGHSDLAPSLRCDVRHARVRNRDTARHDQRETPSAGMARSRAG
jgi:hypothetical protein